MWDPNYADEHFNLHIEFNKHISAEGYARARDAVILTKGVKIVSENESARTMNIEFNDAVAKKIPSIAGVEAVTTHRISGSDQDGGCFNPRR